MVYLPANTFSNILSYCDDRVEQNQRIHLAKCMAVLKHLKFLASHGNCHLDHIITCELLWFGDDDEMNGQYTLGDLGDHGDEHDQPFWHHYDETAGFFGLATDRALSYYCWETWSREYTFLILW